MDIQDIMLSFTRHMGMTISFAMIGMRIRTGVISPLGYVNGSRGDWDGELLE
jgi:hypothetical protein